MKFICPVCGDGLPENEECPCTIAVDDDVEDVPKHRDSRRKFTVTERIQIGERDNWLCGICQDLARPVEHPPVMVIRRLTIEDLVVEDVASGELSAELPERLPRRPLSASIDHIVPRIAGGGDDPGNLQIAHLFCNLHKNAFSSGHGFTRPEYVRAVLADLMEGTPVPELIHRGCFPSWAYLASRQVEFMISLYIAAGVVDADPSYGDPASRSEPFIRKFGNDRWQEAVADIKTRRAEQRAHWGLSTR
jgi:HNH endonuclease